MAKFSGFDGYTYMPNTRTVASSATSTTSSWTTDGYYTYKPAAAIEVAEDGSLYYNINGTKYRVSYNGIEQVAVQEKPKIKEIVLEEVDISFEL